MDSVKKRKLRFHLVTSSMLAAFAVVLTLSLLYAAYSKFQQMGDESARIIFGQLSREGAGRFSASIESARHLVDVQAGMDYPIRIPVGTADQKALEARFVADLAVRSNLYSFYIGTEHGEFFQVVAVRQHPKIAAALKAPAEATSAIRYLQVRNGKREEYWRFFNERGRLLSERRGETTYDPRQRPWYADTIKSSNINMADPYRFNSSGELGVTLAKRLAGGKGVVGLDINLEQMGAMLTEAASTPMTVLVLLDAKDRVLAVGKGAKASPAGQLAPLTPLQETANPQLLRLGAANGFDSVQIVSVDDERYALASYAITTTQLSHYRVVAYAPLREFSRFAVEAREQMVGLALLLLLLAMPLVIVGSLGITRDLRRLAKNAEKIEQMDFSAAKPVHSVLAEIDKLGRAQTVMNESLAERTEALQVSQQKLESLIRAGLDLGRERDRMALLRRVLLAGVELTHSDGGTLYLLTEKKTLSFAMHTLDSKLPSFEIPLYDPENGAPNEKFVSTYVALHNQVVVIDDVYAESRFDLSGTRKFNENSSLKTISMLTLPLSPRDGEVIGVLQFMNARDAKTGEIATFDEEIVTFVKALAAQAAVALDNHQLVEAQKVLMESLIKLIASAVDAKSPYTGGHCERVPELAIMLAEEASRCDKGSLADFRWANDDERREFRIGAWLHDCGKVTTPEYVVDKATKLETLYDRIHEIRTRFEVLWRDSQIDYLQACLDGMDRAMAQQAMEQRRAQLQADFAFIAECNEGGEFMAPEKIDRLKVIAAQTWLRHFDDRIGLSHEALRRLQCLPRQELPVVENLLADKPYHILPRTDFRASDPRHGFKLKIPKNLYNLGEVYNLSIQRGTLTEEERYKINEHIVQTIMMLDSLPLPKNLKRVPEYAGTHHETLLGTGYPRQLKAADLSVPSRIMAIADIFEALTASDRPYKKPKKLSECIKILSFFKKDKHIDGELFDLFLTSGAYMVYARQYLRVEQIDEVDISVYLG